MTPPPVGGGWGVERSFLILSCKDTPHPNPLLKERGIVNFCNNLFKYPKVFKNYADI
jgi:hypothetical protein